MQFRVTSQNTTYQEQFFQKIALALAEAQKLSREQKYDGFNFFVHQITPGEAELICYFTNGNFSPGVSL